MNELELRIRVQGMTKQWVEDFMNRNGVSATLMEDALTKVLADLKDKSLQEFIIAVSNPMPVEVQEQKEE